MAQGERRAWPSNVRRLAALVAITLVPAAFAGSGTAHASTAIGCDPGELMLAILFANITPAGDTISLQAGCTYTLTARYGSSSSGLPRITSDIIIDGNGARIERDPSAPGFTLFDVGPDGVLLLSDVTLAEGSGTNGSNVANAGATTIVDSTITNAVPFGQNAAGVWNGSSGVMAIIDSTLEHQVVVSDNGGAVENAGDLVVTGTTFSENGARGPVGQPANGGAILNTGTARIFGSTFSGNIANATGGGILNTGYLEVRTSSFLSNVANFGAAIRSSGSFADLTVHDSYFFDNHASVGGGAIHNSGLSIAQIVDSTFDRNLAASPNFPCCVGGSGGAILNDHALRVHHSTFAGNRASTGQTVASPTGLASFEASVLDGSSPCSGTIVDLGSTLVHPSRGSCPATFVVGDPRLGSPVPALGGTKVRPLGPGSDAVDLVPTSGCLAHDQRGAARPAGPRCDAGAYEDQLPSAPGAPALRPASVTPNQGSFSLGWPAATDPDGTSPMYRLYHKDADDSDLGFVATAAGPLHTFTAPEQEGTFRYAVRADDGNHLSGLSPVSGPIVVDRTAPTAPAASPDRPPDAVGWYRDTVTVTFSGSTDPPLQDGSPGSGVAAVTPPQTRSASGVHTISGATTDHAGNGSAATSVAVSVDAEDPTIAFTSCPADVILRSFTAASWSAFDASSGLATSAGDSIQLDTSTLGTKSVTASAADNVGHTAQATCVYRVIFDFSGFFAPLVNPPAELEWTAGDGVPVSFGLAGDQGLAVLAPGYPKSVEITCGTSPAETGGEATSSPRGLSYNAARERYRYVWTTRPAWAGTCRQLVVQLIDGTYHRANLRFGAEPSP